MTSAQAQKAIDELVVLIDRGGDYTDATRLRRFEGLTAQLRSWDGAGSPFRGKLGSAVHWAAILFSPRKHEQYGGVDKIRSSVIADLSDARRFIPDQSSLS
jgi:hypothetical protein